MLIRIPERSRVFSKCTNFEINDYNRAQPETVCALFIGGIMFSKKSDEGYVDVLEGIKRKTVIWGEKTLMSEFRIKKGSAIPMHDHPHEQIGYIISGRMKFTAKGESFIAEPGDSWCFPGNIEHGAEILEDSVIVEVFSPVREEYLPD
jgi:quercetin dioxygenase-like cupin family protein